MKPLFSHAVTRRLQKIGWVYLTRTGRVRCTNDFRMVQPSVDARFIPITTENYARVAEFREQDRVPEYARKLAAGEVGYFAECGGAAVGSIWASVNRSPSPAVVRGYMKLMPTEALIHDVVTGPDSRGKGIGPFMVSSLAAKLLQDDGVSQVIIDVNFRNAASLRMVQKTMIPMPEVVLSVVAFRQRLLQATLRR